MQVHGLIQILNFINGLFIDFCFLAAEGNDKAMPTHIDLKRFFHFLKCAITNKASYSPELTKSYILPLSSCGGIKLTPELQAAQKVAILSLTSSVPWAI
jgi:hypothetical protein